MDTSRDGKLQMDEILAFCDQAVKGPAKSSAKFGVAGRAMFRTRDRARKLATTVRDHVGGGPQDGIDFRGALMLFYPDIAPDVIDRFIERCGAEERAGMH